VYADVLDGTGDVLDLDRTMLATGHNPFLTGLSGIATKLQVVCVGTLMETWSVYPSNEPFGLYDEVLIAGEM
jgi:hypothetical protein